MTDDDERDAREWLRNKADHKAHPYSDKCRTILALLDAPRMPRPEDVPGELLAQMHMIFHTHDMRAAYRVLYDRYTPKPKAEAWAVKWRNMIRYFSSEREAREHCEIGGVVVKLVEAADE